MPSLSAPTPSPSRDSAHHWEQVYRTRDATQVSWYRPHLERSLAYIQAAAPKRSTDILDVGGGASTLVDDLLAHGYAHVSVLDLSAAALRTARERLGTAANRVVWRQGDVRTMTLPAHSLDVWHDRAAFHFLTDAADRRVYLQQVLHALRPQGHLVIATFAPDGPQRCSGLPVLRYDAAALQREFGDAFCLQAQASETHATPGGSLQAFVCCHFARTA